ncbi:MAG: bifunctional hydroxymethylpyrimidine kinase/phosphomethylpyrimidine kinase [Myxococcaceae bacterium]
MAPRAADRQRAAQPRAVPRLRQSRPRGASLSSVLICSGLDPSGRAGALADLWAATRLKAGARLVITALTAQGKRFALQSNARFLKPQLDSALSNGPVGAVKLGMIPDRASLAVLVGTLERLRVPVVVDPVTFSSRGERLSKLRPADFLRLAGHFSVITPNAAEAEWLGGPRVLLDSGYRAVVVKGGETGVDRLFTAEGERAFRGRPLRRTPSHRGTGCRFATAVACGLAAGAPIGDATVAAKRLVRKFLSRPILIGP